MVLHFYSTFPVYYRSKCFTILATFTHSHIHGHTDGGGCHARRQLGSVDCWRTLDMQLGGAKIQTSDRSITRWPALPPEIQPTLWWRWFEPISIPKSSSGGIVSWSGPNFRGTNHQGPANTSPFTRIDHSHRAPVDRQFGVSPMPMDPSEAAMWCCTIRIFQRYIRFYYTACEHVRAICSNIRLCSNIIGTVNCTHIVRRAPQGESESILFHQCSNYLWY